MLLSKKFQNSLAYIYMRLIMLISKCVMKFFNFSLCQSIEGSALIRVWMLTRRGSYSRVYCSHQATINSNRHVFLVQNSKYLLRIRKHPFKELVSEIQHSIFRLGAYSRCSVQRREKEATNKQSTQCIQKQCFIEICLSS